MDGDHIQKGLLFMRLPNIVIDKVKGHIKHGAYMIIIENQILKTDGKGIHSIRIPLPGLIIF